MRYATFDVLHRNEVSGALAGAHAGAAVLAGRLPRLPDGVADPGGGAAPRRLHLGYYQTFGLQSTLKFATRPPQRIGSDELWDRAEASLKAALEATGLPYRAERRGMARSTGRRSTSTCTMRSAGRGSWGPSSSTSRPERFDLTYGREDNHPIDRW